MQVEIFVAHTTNSHGEDKKNEDTKKQGLITKLKSEYEDWLEQHPNISVFDVQFDTSTAGEKWHVHFYISLIVVYRQNATIFDRVKNAIARLTYHGRPQINLNSVA